MFENVHEFALQVKRTLLSLSDKNRSRTAEAGSVSRRAINALDYHNAMAESITTPRRVHAPIGAVFGQPTPNTSSAVYWKNRDGRPEWQADTQPKRKSLSATKAGTPPNPGRPELGGEVEL